MVTGETEVKDVKTGSKSSRVRLVRFLLYTTEIKSKDSVLPGKQSKYFPPVSTQWSHWARKVATKSGNTSSQLAATLALGAPKSTQAALVGRDTTPRPVLSLPG